MLSETVGLKETLITAFCPAANVRGMATPLAAKSLAFTVTCEMVKLVFPLLVRVTFLELELPAFTLAKLRLVGLVESVTEAATPVPLKATEVGEFGALLETLMVPARLPAVVGANRTLNVAVLPAASVAGVASPLTLYAVPVTDNCAMVREPVPVLVTVKF